MSSVHERAQLRQRADYTYKFNAKTGRHGWLRLTPAYSVKIVEDIILDHEAAKRILDPFCGTGTTALSAAYHGHETVTTDINPFLLWLAQAKTAQYSSGDIAAGEKACANALTLVRKEKVDPIATPPLHNIERWWNPPTLQFLRLLRAAIEEVTEPRTAERTLLLVAFCRTLIGMSNAAFNHQSMSFRDEGQLEIGFDIDLPSVYRQEVQVVIEGAHENPSGACHVCLGDSRDLSKVVQGKFDLVVTSPPYANRMSYIRELRPYMYWLGFLSNGRDAGELDWSAIGGTWGIATSRLMDWSRPFEHFSSNRLTQALDKIAHAQNRSGEILSNYVAKYFDDMWAHFRGLVPVLAPGAELHYIVGNSTFYGTVVSTELLYAEMLESLEFSSVECRPIRKRNSKKELVEYDVVARWR